jgi:site-specific DNA-methyltransferase (cytosine-N4-specific)
MSKVNTYDVKYSQLRDVDWNFSCSKQDSISVIHPYPARFIQDIPRKLIECLGVPKSNCVFDPFCGSGTTLLEAKNQNIDAIGVDLNPIACLISRVKVQSIPDDFSHIAKLCLETSYNNYDSNTKIPTIPNLDHWFKDDIQKAISVIMSSIKPIENQQVKDALMFALSSIIVRVSNQESDTRYAAIDKAYTAESVFDAFRLACKKVATAKIESVQTESTVNIINGDVLSVNKENIDRNIGLVITSPPYPNAYEYWLYHKYRMWWLGYDPIQVREFEIGARPHFQKKNGQTEKDFRRQMSGVFELFDTRLIQGGHVCIVIGRSIIKGKVIDNAEMMKEIAQERGYAVIADIEREIATTKKSFNLKYGKIKNENIVIFRKDNI